MAAATRSRRKFILTIAALWEAAKASTTEQPVRPYRFSILDEGRRNTFRALAERLIPADQRSAGALGARVDEYADFILVHADPMVQKTWRDGLTRYGEAITGLDSGAVDAFLATQAAREFAPRTADEAFFVILKAVVTEGFYTSQIGIEKELGYRGMTFLLDFPGCTHKEHRVPENWRPVLQQQRMPEP